MPDSEAHEAEYVGDIVAVTMLEADNVALEADTVNDPDVEPDRDSVRVLNGDADVEPDSDSVAVGCPVFELSIVNVRVAVFATVTVLTAETARMSVLAADAVGNSIDDVGDAVEVEVAVAVADELAVHEAATIVPRPLHCVEPEQLGQTTGSAAPPEQK